MDSTIALAPAQAAESRQQKFRKLLAELFMLDQADLDFGIYRIMNAKRDEIKHFLDNDLLPQIRQELNAAGDMSRTHIKDELEKAEQNAIALGVDPDQSPKVSELRARFKEAADPSALEAEVFSLLYQFFNRYYNEGDFISQRRYREGVYAIPYEGEEVKLYWANHDQYYIKTSEYFRDYTFKLADGRRVHFKLVEADTEQNNNKAAEGKERRFRLVEEDPVSEENEELFIHFRYEIDPDNRKQDALNVEAIKRILKLVPDTWRLALSEKKPTEKNPSRTLLEKRIADYTARNTFDYFIHKDLGGFLRRELDFFIKNEVVHLDDIEDETAPRVESYLAKVRALRRVGHKIIDFLAQLEDFQKRLWLKKKFVVETNYCITLDRVPEELYPEVAANDAQREEWVRLFAIDELPDYSSPLTIDFLKNNPFFVLDTVFFDESFIDRLLASIEDLDERIDGLIIHSENFQALCLLEMRYNNEVQCIYIDPPYNSKTTEIAYKNNYKHSSWISLMDCRLGISRRFSNINGSHIIAIDENEQEVLGQLLEQIFPEREKVCIAVVHNKKGIQGDYFSYNHEYAYFCISRNLSGTHGKPVPEEEWDYDNLRKWGRESERHTARNCFYPIIVRNGQIIGFGDVCDEDFHPNANNVQDGDNILVYPIDSKGVERKWRYARDSVESILPLLKVHTVKGSGEIQIQKAKAEKALKTVWDDTRYIAGDYGTKWLTDLGLKFSENIYPKSIHTVEDSVFAISEDDSIILDFFAGSGTTGHAVINLNRNDNGTRKYILVEVSDYFDTILKPRIQKVIYSKDWRDGKPVSREGSSHLFKYLLLESYEDTLNNLELRRTEKQQELLNGEAGFREEYMLRYMLDVESRGSASLLNINRFDDPFNYELKIGTGSAGETRPRKVDIVETFNYLIGLRVHHIDRFKGIRVVQGESPEGERVLIIWRNVHEVPNELLDEFFRKQGYNTQDREFDVIYVNGDNNLENLRREDETWKVRLIEEEFAYRMFDVQDV